jgi:ankyrin repeat protein
MKKRGHGHGTTKNFSSIRFPSEPMGSKAPPIPYLTIVPHPIDSFRWISRWPNSLPEDILERIRNASDKLGTSRDETFGQRLHDIPEEKSQRALLLFKCLVASIRPLTITELEDIFATELGLGPTLNAEGAVLTPCCALIVVVDEDSRTIRFSSPEVKEFLTSDRLRTLYPNRISRYHISPQTAHAALSRACINVLLRSDDTVDKAGLGNSSLTSYAVQYWVKHTQCDNVASQNQDVMVRLFDPNKPYLAWVWMCDIEKSQKRATDDLSSNLSLSPRIAALSTPTPLYYAALYGFSGLVNYLVTTRAEPVNAKGGYYGTPLHAASYKGHVDTVNALIKAEADVKTTNGNGNKTPLHAAFYGGHLDVMQVLLKHGADVDARDPSHNTLLHQASLDGQVQVMDLLFEYDADAKASNQNGWTPLHRAALCGRIEVANLLVAKGADVNAQSQDKNTPLHIGSIAGKLEVVRLLLDHGADTRIRGEHNWMPLEAAKARGHDDVVRLLSRSGHTGRWFDLPMMRNRLSVQIGDMELAASKAIGKLKS